MMAKYVLVLCCLAAALVAGQKYTDKYDNINLKEILENKRLLQGYVDCALDKGKCTPDGKELKEHIREAMETGCEKCTETQKDGTYTVISHLIHHEPDMWNALCAKYDSAGQYRKKYEDLAKERGIELPK